ncbi:TetR/AcrR family transcriptional regulator [Mesonia sp. MT50]|uniref:TetR/AcrR family transcriptional regulator n=1 Tax=Mesonia profundi TaxID=3070998 RepID=A0ABU1A1F9_9FLAO|nr:TetR/AcrR family transcriptional regulator [Mesonia profundi]MDQ7917539.1 TetR/AcrR family transcriptional regulator [Mesonia profundi]
MKPNRKEEIILKAAQLFKEKGYNAVSMRDLAQDLGIKAASLYNHIHSKQEILEGIIMQVARDFTLHIHEVSPKPISAIQKLEEIIQMHIDLTIQKTDFLACMNNDWMHLEEENRANYIDMRADYETKFREILQEGIAAKELKESDPEIMLFSILSTLRTFYLWYAKNKNINPNVLKKDLTQTLLQGIIV